MADLRERVETVLATAGGGMIDGYLALNVISIWGGYVRENQTAETQRQQLMR
jgi:hypothetical protein